MVISLDLKIRNRISKIQKICDKILLNWFSFIISVFLKSLVLRYTVVILYNGQQWTHLLCAACCYCCCWKNKREAKEEEETKVLRAINIIFNILDQFFLLLLPLQAPGNFKSYWYKILSNKKMSSNITVRNEVQVKVISIFNI